MQEDLFEFENNLGFDPLNYWKEMPEYNNIKEKEPEIIATFKFKTKEDFLKFESLLKEHVYKCKRVFDGMQSKTKKQAWFPLKEKASSYEYK